ncbi:hypothetical protein GCM10027160_45920 [Streptomyces calidiresistens]
MRRGHTPEREGRRHGRAGPVGRAGHRVPDRSPTPCGQVPSESPASGGAELANGSLSSRITP